MHFRSKFCIKILINCYRYFFDELKYLNLRETERDFGQTIKYITCKVTFTVVKQLWGRIFSQNTAQLGNIVILYGATFFTLKCGAVHTQHTIHQVTFVMRKGEKVHNPLIATFITFRQFANLHGMVHDQQLGAVVQTLWRYS